MPATSSSSMPDCETTSPTGQKIRESCDACSSQKIRCGKERPSCSRCASKGVECVYGMSRRTGRRRRSPVTSPYATPRHAPSTLAIADDLHLLTSLNSFDNASWMFDTSPELPKTMDMDMQYLDPSFGDDFNTAIRPERDSISSSISSSSLMSGSNEDLDMLFGLPSSSSQPPAPVPQMLQPLPSTTPSALSVKQCPTAQYGNAPHRCITTVLQLVADLHATRGPIGNTRDIDTVLNNNRTALKMLDRILDCTCSNEQEVLIPVFLAAQQTLLWYEAALCIDPLGMASVMDRVVTSQVMMGNYCLDVDAQGLVRAHVVLAEMRLHIQPLLVRLQQRNINNPVNPPHSDDHGSEVVECYQRTLRLKLTAVVSKANSLKTG